MVARGYAFGGEREKARDVLYDILEYHPNHVDGLLLLGRTLAWDKMYDSARVELKKALAIKKYYKDAINALIDLETWSHNYGKAIYYIDHGLAAFPRNEEWLMKKANLLIKVGREEEARRVLSTILDLDPLKTEAIELIKTMKKSSMLNAFLLDYAFEYFDKPWTRRWHLIGVGYKRNTKFGSLFGRIYMSDLVRNNEVLFEKETGTQFEIEAYPKVAEKYYMYVAYAYSPDRLFPVHRSGVELFHSFPLHFEGSLGMRFIEFRNDSTAEVKDIIIYTASVGYYYRSYWISFRPYITPETLGISQSYNLEIRKYLKSADNYFSLSLGIGNSPDEPSNYTKEFEDYKLSKKKIRIAFQKLLFKRMVSELTFSYEYEEYKEKKFRDIWAGSLRFKYLF
ncbi:YaiO family outer membrane beta-barrel protein [candidate division KSB1 bacterium]